MPFFNIEFRPKNLYNKYCLMLKTFKTVRNKIAYNFGIKYSQPELFYLKLTERCNLACKNCDIWKSDNHTEMSLTSWKKIISQIKKVSPQANIIISGGEPFLSENFWPLIKHIKDLDLKVTINTNGSLLTDEVINKLIQYRVDKVELSLYSLKKETLETIRGSQLAGQALSALERLVKHELNNKIMIAWLLTKYNIEETPEAIEYFTKQNIWISLQPLDSNVQALDNLTITNSDITNNPLWPKDKESITQTFNQLIRMKKEGLLIYNRLSQLELIKDYYLNNLKAINKLPCYCGVKNFIVSSQGNVHFCFSGPAIGNLLQQSAQEIWQSAKAQSVRQQNNQCLKPCRIMNCNYQPTLTKMVKEYIIKQVSLDKINK